jgi:DNA modification methylase
MRELPDGCCDLVYLDPPFFSNRQYEVVFGDEAEVRTFEDRWAGGILHYLDWMRDRVAEMHRLLRDDGSLYLHCDPTASHYLKVMLDEIFTAPGGFRSEIVWKRTSAHSDTKQGRRQHGRVHDVILFFTKGEQWTWNPIYTPYDPEYVERFYKYVEPETGRRYRLGDLTGPGGAAKGNPEYEVMGVTRFWRYSRERMDDLIAQGRVVQTKPGAVPAYKRYLDEGKGVPLQDVWTDIKPIGAQAAERLHYPTQKPEALLRRIIEASSDKGAVVVDPFCGCGTAIAVAHALEREWIGIDIAPTAIRICEARMHRLGADFITMDMPQTPDALLQLAPFEFQHWVISQIRGKQAPRRTADKGIDGTTATGEPVQVKRSRRIGREVVDTFQTAIVRARKSRGYLIAGSFTRGAHEEAARARQETGLDIRLVPVADLLDEGKLAAHGLTSAQLFGDPGYIPPPEPDALPSAEQLVLSDMSTEQDEPDEAETKAIAEDLPERVEDIVQVLLERTGITQPPIPLEPLLEGLNIELSARPGMREDAAVVPMTDPSLGHPAYWMIYYNPDRPPARQRFTLAHEIGHVLLHGAERGVAASARSGRGGARERQVDRFAEELLMPAPMVRAAVRQYGTNVERLRALFLVSKAAMERRLRTLKLA